MVLTLEVTGPEAEKLGAGARKVFQATGGTIGRLPDNAWVLPDPYVSSRHAVIRFQNGVFYIEDTSTNGVFINTPDNALAKGRPYPLKSGDWIFIEPYEIRAVVTGEAKESTSPFEDLFPANLSDGRSLPPEPVTSSPVLADLFDPSRSDLELDPLKLLGGEPVKPVEAPAPRAVDLERNPVWGELYDPPVVPPQPGPAPAASGGPIPENWFDDRSAVARAAPSPPQDRLAKSAGDAVRAQRPRPPVSPPSPPSQDRPKPSGAAVAPAVPASNRDVDLSAILAAAGVPDVPQSRELAQSFGKILRIVVGGVMDMLRARQQTKSALGLEQTLFKPADNNPLKFSANVDDALHNLLVKRNTAFLEPVEAFTDAFEDVKHHQIAMLHGMRVAFESMLAQFDPDRLQDEFDRHVKKGALVAMPSKLRYWESYRERIRELMKDPEASFEQLFGEEFATAYQEQLKRLKAQNRAGNA